VIGQEHVRRRGTSAKTATIVRLAVDSDTAGLPELPEEIQLTMTDIASVAGEGLAMSVAAGMAVMQAMFEVEIAAACGQLGQVLQV
jgi:putative transposase